MLSDRLYLFSNVLKTKRLVEYSTSLFYAKNILQLTIQALTPSFSLPIKAGIWLLWPLLTSARSPYELPHKAPPFDVSYLPILNSSSLFRSSISGWMLSWYRRCLVNRSPLPVISPDGRMKHQKPHVKQVSPDKNVNFCYTTAAFTISPEPWASLCCANSPGNLALYAVSVRRLIALHSGLAAPFSRFRLRLTFRFAPPSDGLSRFRPCLRLILLLDVFSTLTGFTYRGTFTPLVHAHAAGRTQND